MKTLFSLTIFVVLFAFDASSQTIIGANVAAGYIGKTVIITEKVYSGKLMRPSNTTVLNIGGYAPEQQLTVIISAANRSKFKGKPEEDFKGKDITVSGKVVRYKGKPGIIVSDPKQLKVILIDNTKGVPAKQF